MIGIGLVITSEALLVTILVFLTTQT